MDICHFDFASTLYRLSNKLGIFTQSLFSSLCVYTDRFQSDGREESIDHEVDFLRQVRHTEVLKQSFFAAQTIYQHTEPQPIVHTHRHTHFMSCTDI